MQPHLDIDRVLNATAYDTHGDKIGSVGQLYLHDETGEPAWVSINTGFFGTSQSFAPMEGARLDDDDHLVVAVAKDVVKDAPRIDDDGHLNESEYRTLYDYYAGYLGAGRDRGLVDADRDVADRDRDRNLTDRDRVAAGNVDRDRRGDVDRGDSVVAHEERLNVDKERREVGQVRLRKHVVTRNETVTVPVEREEVEVVREPVGAGERGGKMGDDDAVVTLHEERPVVDKEVVAKERVGLQKNVVRDNETVTEQVREEQVDVDRSGVGTDRGGRGVDEKRKDGVVDEPRGVKDKDRDVLSKEDMDRDGKRETKLDLNKDGRDDLGRDKR